MKIAHSKQAEQLFKSYEIAVTTIGQGLMNFPWENEEFYTRWCAQTFYMVQHTTRFLCLTASQFGVEWDQYHNFCLGHLREETGHELLALRDLESFGHDIKDYPASLEAEMMIQSQYFWIQKSAFNHFGFFWILEQLSVSYAPQIIKRVHKAHGKACTQFLDLHAAEDIQHVKDITEAVKNFPETVIPSLEKNIIQTGRLYTQMLLSLQIDKVYKQAG